MLSTAVAQWGKCPRDSQSVRGKIPFIKPLEGLVVVVLLFVVVVFLVGGDGCGYRNIFTADISQYNVLNSVYKHKDILHCYFLFQPVLHDWCNKGRGMCYPVCGMVHIKEHLLLIGKSSLCGGSGFLFSLSEWSLTICLTPYNHK